MRKPMAKKVLAASMAAAMTMSVAACGGKVDSTPASTEPEVSTEPEEVSKYTVLKDANGDTLDLGGIEVTIYDWFSKDKEPETNYEIAQAEYREWIQETYNFTVKVDGTGDWGDNANQLTNYINGNGDDRNMIYVVYGENATVLSLAEQGLLYDLSKLTSIDLNDKKYTDNGVTEAYTFGGGTWAMHAGPTEPRMGVFFNRDILEERGIKPDSIYEMQANGTWTWDAFEELVKQCTFDRDGDMETDVYGLTVNEANMTTTAVFSNNGDFVGVKDGQYVYMMEDENTVEALEWALHMYQTYDWDGPEAEDGSVQWDYYKEQFVNGGAAFCVDETWIANSGATFADIEHLGFVMFPAGPKGDMVQYAKDNLYIIPGCYDDERANKIALAFDLWNEYVPGYEDYNPFMNSFLTGNYETKAIEETVPLMSKKSKTPVFGLIPNNMEFIYSNFVWKISPRTSETISELLEADRELALKSIDEANAR